jgi:hypothetical protein
LLKLFRSNANTGDVYDLSVEITAKRTASGVAVDTTASVAEDGFTLDSEVDQTAYALGANLCEEETFATAGGGGHMATGAVVRVRIVAASNLNSMSIQDVLLHTWRVYSLSQPYVFLNNMKEFGAPGNVELRALSCSIVVDHIEMKCTTPPAVGRGFSIGVSVGGQKSPKSHTAIDYASAIVLTLVPFVIDPFFFFCFLILLFLPHLPT